MRKLILGMLLLAMPAYMFAQTETDNYTRWYLKPAVGLNIPLTHLLSDRITDNLVDYDDNSFYWQVLSATYFVSPKFGIDLTIQAGHSFDISGRAARFNSDLKEMYSDKYFVSPRSGAEYDDFSPILGSIERGYLGLVYRIEKPKYLILPKILIGVTSFYTDWGSADLKEKGSNTMYVLTYDSGKRPNDHLMISPSVSLGYRFSKRILANLDIFYSIYKADFDYQEELRNAFTDVVLVKNMGYHKTIHTLTIGMGMIIEL